MSDITFVTTFSQDGYKLYGRKMLDTFTQYNDYKILVYYETKAHPVFRHKNIEYRSLSKVPGAIQTLQAMQQFPAMQGIIGDKRYYNWDIYKFARKMFAQCDAATYETDILCWMDADVEFEKAIPQQWIEDLFAEREDGSVPMCAVMNRPSFHLCASFVAWNQHHEQALSFWNTYYDLLTSGRFAMLPEWHDSYLLQSILEGADLDCKNIAEHYELGDGPVNVFDSVFRGVAHHKKGHLKNEEADDDQRTDTQQITA